MSLLSISNIAWPVTSDSRVSSLVRSYVNRVDIAPTKYFKPGESDLISCSSSVFSFWQQNNISVSAFQSLLFDHPHLNIFHSPNHRRDLLLVLEQIAAFASKVGARYLIFGSARNRVPLQGMSLASVDHIARDFFFSGLYLFILRLTSLY